MSTTAPTSPRVFGGRDLEGPDRVLRHLQRGGTALLDGPWPRVRELYERLAARREELVRAAPARGRVGRRATRREWERARRDVLDRLLVIPPPDLAVLFDSPAEPVPVREVVEAEAALAGGYPVRALGGRSLAARPPVFAPRSQETYDLVRRAIEGCRSRLPGHPTVLDLGCGSGILALIAAEVLGPAAAVTATDILPEALAATRLNAERLGLDRVEVTAPGDLFAPVAGRRFDLILFNAPWVAAPVRSETEAAVHDPDGALLGRFFGEVRTHLAQGGTVLLVHTDHSPQGTPSAVERLAAGCGLRVTSRLRARVKTHRRREAWEGICVYELVAEDGTEGEGLADRDR